MNVRDLSIALRPRSSWEAVDLGTALAKRYYSDLFGIGLRSFGVFVLIFALCCWWTPWLLIGVAWWLKPLVDRFYLYYLSRRIFGESVSVQKTLGQWKRLLFQGSFSLLTWRRFSFYRGMNMAVADLEELRGSEHSQRCGVVTRVGSVQALLVMLGGFLLELMGLFSALILAQLLIPQGQGQGWNEMAFWFQEGGVGPTMIVLSLGLIYGVLVLFLEPLYLASSFALYLNSRTRQEAWDVELRFRELALRVEKTRVKSSQESPSSGSSRTEGQLLSSSQSKSAVLMLILGLMWWSSDTPLLAQEERAPQVVIQEVISDEAFTVHKETYKERVNQFSEREKKSNQSFNVGAIDGLFQLVGILALCLLVIFILVIMVHLLQARSRGGVVKEKAKFKRAAPSVVMGMDVTSESLPADLVARAKEIWQSGDARQALSLLYRGALTKLITEEDVAIRDSDTEYECLSEVEGTVSEGYAGYFRKLSQQWMKAAYSEEVVEDGEFEFLCTAWPFSS